MDSPVSLSFYSPAALTWPLILTRSLPEDPCITGAPEAEGRECDKEVQRRDRTWRLCATSERRSQPFLSRGTQKLITKILQHTKKCIILFADLTKTIGISLIHSHRTAIVVLAVVISLFDNLREKRSVPLTGQGLDVLKTLAAHWLKIAAWEKTVLMERWGWKPRWRQ